MVEKSQEKYADLPYLPSQELYEKRSLEVRAKITTTTALPDGYPSEIISPLAWKSPGIKQKKDQWMFRLSGDDLHCIDDAVRRFEERDLPLQDLSPTTFGLSPSLASRLLEASESLYDGVGFTLIRGVDSHRYTTKQNIVIQSGMTSYFGSLRGFNGPSDMNVLAHVRDLKNFFPGSDIISPTFTNKAMTMHTDLGDIVSLFAINRGASGGSFRLASSWTVYNTLVKKRPDVLKVLSDGFVFDPLHPEVPPYERPLLHHHDGKVLLQSFRRPFTGFGNTPRSPDLPPLTDAQKEALDTLYFTGLAESFSIDFENGDLLLFNNLALLHARDRYITDEENPRHLLKMYVRNPDKGWKMPPVLQEQWQQLYQDRSCPRKENFPVMFPTVGHIPLSGWTQNG